MNIIPQPQSIEFMDGQFILDQNTRICGDKELEDEMNFLADLIGLKSTFRPKVENMIREKGSCIIFQKVEAKHDEYYEIDVQAHALQISAKSRIGFLHAIQSLRQLFPANFNGDEKLIEKSWAIPSVKIADQPNFKWRGMLLDCCRHFMPKEFVKRYIDLLAYHKMNVLHWHLTEDQGWRIEIKKYPLLTEKGAWREGKDGKPYGGFYTQEDIKEIVDYAYSRGISIVPEIEMPGHSVAAISSYPHLSCTGEQIPVETEWGVFKDIYCAGNDQTFEFLKDVLDEVMLLFPGEYIHIGGDEAPKFRWENCSKCQKRMDEEGLNDEHELQSWFIQEIENYLSSKGRILIGWDEILEGGLAEGAVVQSWRGVNGGIEAAKERHDVIMSPTSHCYFDYSLKSIDLEKVYSFNPIPEELAEDKQHHILGAECNMWSERAPFELVDSKVFPRILAMSEVLWSAPFNRDFDDFYKRVQEHYPRLSALGVDYGLETDPISFATYFEDGLRLQFHKGIPDLDVFYSRTDSHPTPSDLRFDDFIPIDKNEQIFAQAFKSGKTYGEPLAVEVKHHLAIGLDPKYDFEWSPYYTGGGKRALTNGLIGSLDFRDGNWQAVQFDDVECVLDLGGKEVQTIESHFYQYNNSWIFVPEWVEYAVSENGEEWELLERIASEHAPEESGKFIQVFNTSFEPRKVNYLKLKAKNIQYCPDWHEAAGSSAWLFIDEIQVR
ncbi:MAG: beta-N-acetylhexosaminidase [Bacteroidota bacterium]